MRKMTKANELSWLLGIVLCSLGVALCTKANFGLSMIAAPPFIIHLKFFEIFPWYSQGTSEYIWQGFLLVVMCVIVRKFKWKYLLSFAVGIIFGLFLDFWLALFGSNVPYESMQIRVIAFVIGEMVTAVAVAFYFRTSLPLQIYELLVVEIAEQFNFDKNKTKLANDIIMLVVSLVLAMLLNRNLRGIGIGTVIITVVNAKLIEKAGKIIDKFFGNESKFPRLIKALEK